MDIPIEHRFIEVVFPGVFCGDYMETKWPRESWNDERALVSEVMEKYPAAVGLRRFHYDPCKGKSFIDDGWLYFGNTVLVIREDAIADDWMIRLPEVRLTEIARSNIRINGFDRCVYFKKTGTIYPLAKCDRVII